MICYFANILVYLLIFATVCNFSIYKLIGNPAKLYKGICVSEPSALDLIPHPQFVFTGSGPQYVFTIPGTQFVLSCSLSYN